MTGTHRWKLLTAAVALALGGMGAHTAQAGLLIQASVNGGPLSTIASGASGSSVIFSGSLGTDAVVNLSATSNSPGSPSFSKLLGSTLDLTNTSTVSSETIKLIIGDTGFMEPTALPVLLLNSHIGGTVVKGGAANLLDFYSCIDPTNAQNGCGAGSITSPTSDPTITTSVAFSNDQYAHITSLGAPYSMTQFLTLTLAPRGEINFADNTTLSVVPEPASYLPFAVGMLGLMTVYFGAARRRS